MPMKGPSAIVKSPVPKARAHQTVATEAEPFQNVRATGTISVSSQKTVGMVMAVMPKKPYMNAGMSLNLSFIGILAATSAASRFCALVHSF